jgi:hypothetical protein
MYRSRLLMVVAGVVAVALLVPAAGHAGRAPVLTWSPTTGSGTYDYGTVDVLQTKSVTFTLSNSGGSASAQLAISLIGSSAFTTTSDRCTAKSIGPNHRCTVTIEYAPTTAGNNDSATLTVTGAKPAATATITLTGAAGNADLALSVAGLPTSPATVLPQGVPVTFVIGLTNTTGADQTFTFSSNQPDIAPASTDIAAGATDHQGLTLEPVAPKGTVVSGQLAITTNAPNHPTLAVLPYTYTVG